MAKKTSKNPAEAEAPQTPPASGESAPDKESKKGKEPKAKEPRAKAPKAKTAPAAPAAESPAPATTPPAVTAPAPAAVPVTGEPTKKRGKRPGTGPRRGKKLRNLLINVQQKLAKEGPTPIKKAVSQLKQMKRAKFDETVEIHMALGIDMTQSDQMVRGTVSLPHGLGKSVRVLVFCQGDNVAKAKEAGADYAGSDDLIKRIQGEGWLEFDVALATQDMMGMVSRLGKVLGPRGLMPTPKAGTVVTAGGDVGAAVREFKAGKVEYRADKGGNVHAGVGKLSFDETKLVDNVTAFVEQVRAVKPAGVKGNYVKSMTLSATMSPGISVIV
jgi:large subunit ribosomal protein L1